MSEKWQKSNQPLRNSFNNAAWNNHPWLRANKHKHVVRDVRDNTIKIVDRMAMGKTFLLKVVDRMAMGKTFLERGQNLSLGLVAKIHPTPRKRQKSDGRKKKLTSVLWPPKPLK